MREKIMENGYGLNHLENRSFPPYPNIYGLNHLENRSFPPYPNIRGFNEFSCLIA